MLNCLFAADKMGSMCLTIKYLGVQLGARQRVMEIITACTYICFGGVSVDAGRCLDLQWSSVLEVPCHAKLYLTTVL